MVHGGILLNKVHMVVKEPLFPHARVRLGESPNALERAYDDARHKRMPRRPTLDVRQVGNVVSIWAYGATHELRGGWDDAARVGTARRSEGGRGQLNSFLMCKRGTRKARDQ